MPTTAFIADSGDASVISNSGYTTMAAAIAGSGTIRSSTVTTDSLPQLDWKSDFTNVVLYRHLVAFDTSAITAAATVTAATLTVRTTGAGDNPTTLCLAQLSGTAAPTFTNADYARVTLTRMAPDISVSTTAGTQTFTLNSAGLAQINKTGWTTFALVIGNEFTADAGAPQSSTAFHAVYVSMDTANHATSANRPTLSVTYSVAGAIPARRPGDLSRRPWTLRNDPLTFRNQLRN